MLIRVGITRVHALGGSLSWFPSRERDEHGRVVGRSSGSPTCRCHLRPHDRCPQARPCLECGRPTTGGESSSPGYCWWCADDPRWTSIDPDRIRPHHPVQTLVMN